jgi:hypothetical protein
MYTYRIEDDDEYWQFYLYQDDEQVGGGTMEYGVDGSGRKALEKMCTSWAQCSAS